MIKVGVALALGLALSACAGTSASERFVRGEVSGSGQAPTTQGRNLTGQAPIGDVFVAPRVQTGTGLESIMGADAAALTQRFGAYRIYRSEGDARKLQFAGNACVLDIYLYPLRAGGTPVATHVEARARDGGASIDRAQCVEALSNSAR